MSAFPARWWIAGGYALELHLGTSWREHDDIDVGICRADAVHLTVALQGWELSVGANGTLTPWRGRPLDADRNEDNLWVRRKGGPWQVDVTIGSGTDTAWVFRRDPAFTVPWDLAVLHTADGTPYLAPELQLLFKSRDPRPKDHTDAAIVIPHLGAAALGVLAERLPPDHPWLALLPAV